MRLAITYSDDTYETFETDDEDAFERALAAGLGLNIRTRAHVNFASKHFFIPFTAIKKIALSKETNNA